MKYTREQILELYKTLPEELKHALDSDRSMDTLEKLSSENNLTNEQVEIFIDAVNEVILGLLHPEEFQSKLEQAQIPKEVSRNINTVVTRFIFYPVKKSLNSLYNIQLQSPGEKPEQKPSLTKDAYREIIE